jgi:hypothetical protein
MNERILEIAEEATRRYDRLGFEIPFAQPDYEKFAELIVRECIAQIEEVKQIDAGHPPPDYKQGMKDGMFVAIETIKEHFGVEQ